MDLNKLHEDTVCNCTQECNEDISSLYAIKTMKDKLRTKDFDSYWEKGKRNTEDCNAICGLKGISVSILNNESEKEIIGIFKQLFSLAPSYKPYFSVIKFGQDSGVLKHTPDSINKYHYDFYKCDSFEFTQVELIKSMLLHEESV